jgi:hypothetical protein
VGLTAPSGVLLLELTSKFPIFLCQHVIVIKQTIPGLLASLVRLCIIKLDMIVGGTFGCDIRAPLVIIHTEVATTCMRDDVIIVYIQVANSTWLVTVLERKAQSRRINEFSGSHVMVPNTLIGVV